MKKCLSCGIVLQQSNKESPGYIINLEHKICYRCFQIKNYNNLVNYDIKADEFLEKIKNLYIKNNKDKYFYYVIDALDIEGSRHIELEKYLFSYNNKNLIIVLNKMDLIPKSVDINKIKDYIINIFKKYDIKAKNIILTSTIKYTHFINLLNSIKRKKECYFIGTSNVGKTSLINKILSTYNIKQEIISSKFFNTTLDIIEIKTDNFTIYDTPGIQKDNSIANQVSVKLLKYFYFDSELKQTTFQLKPNNSIFFATVCWFDFLSNIEHKNSFHIYTNKNIKLHRTNIKNSMSYYNKNNQTILPNIVSDNIYSKEIKFTKNDINKEFDISISGIGWINFVVKKEMTIVINIPKINNNDVLITLRKPLI